MGGVGTTGRGRTSSLRKAGEEEGKVEEIEWMERPKKSGEAVKKNKKKVIFI